MPELLSIEVAIFLCGTFAAAFVTSLSGFAFAMVAAATWLYALPPPQASALIAAYALIVQGYAVWKLRGLLDPHRLMPFILGSALGIPLGVAALRWASPIYIRLGVGLLLVQRPAGTLTTCSSIPSADGFMSVAVMASSTCSTLIHTSSSSVSQQSKAREHPFSYPTSIVFL
jgi:hypothetical protein